MFSVFLTDVPVEF